MDEPQSRRVQRLPAKSEPFEQRSVDCLACTIHLVADQGMADRRHVHADLMRAAGFQPAFDQRGAGPAGVTTRQWVTARLPRGR